jgi:Cu2+-containing amine oxidase
VQSAVQILKKNSEFNSSIRIISIFLKEPHKNLFINRRFENFPSIERKANAILYDSSIHSSFDYSIDLNLEKIISVEKAKSGHQPLYSSDEMFECEKIVLEDNSFKNALKKHYNIEDTKLVMVKNYFHSFYY